MNPIYGPTGPSTSDADSIGAWLVDADPAADVSWSELSRPEMAEIFDRIERARLHDRRPVAITRTLVGVALAVVVLGASLGAVELSGSGQASAALQLDRLAADAQPLPTIQSGTFLERSANVGIAHAEIGTVTGNLHYWADDSTMCAQGTFSPPVFSGNGAQLWSQLGLPTSAVGNPAGSCRPISIDPYDQANPGSEIEDGVGVLNISSLPSDPSVLAGELTAGDTGIPGLDSVTGSGGSDAGLSRAIVLLTVPLLGAPADFPSIILQAISQMPGVRSLGTETTHAGVPGEAFASGEGLQQVTVIFDPNDGSMIEAQNPPQMAALWALPELEAFTGGSDLPSSLLNSAVGEFTPSLDWIDPTGQTSAATAAQLPRLPTIPYQ